MKQRKDRLDVGKIHQALDDLKPLVGRVKELSDETVELDRRLSALNSRVAIAGADAKPTIPVPMPDYVADANYPPDYCGLNIPWLDFGNDIVARKDWGKQSIGESAVKQEMLRGLFQVARMEGFGVIRFWMFPTLWHNKGVYTGDMIVEASESTAMLCKLAMEAKVKLVPTVLSFDNYSFEKANQHSAVIPFENSTHWKLFRESIGQLYRHKDVIDYIDVINEPEWATMDLKDGDPKPGAISKGNIEGHVKEMVTICRSLGSLPLGYGSASLKWRHEYNFSGKLEVHDHHAYEWSIPHFPPNDAAGNGLYIGECHIPYSEWGNYFANAKHDKIFLWMEKDDYRSPEYLQKFLQEFKSK